MKNTRSIVMGLTGTALVAESFGIEGGIPLDILGSGLPICDRTAQALKESEIGNRQSKI
jgi:hypothetical protein